MLLEDARAAGQTEVARDLERVHGAGRHLLSLINDILDISKIEAGRMEVFLEEVEITRLVSDVAGTIEPLAAKNRNTLVVSCPEGIGKMRADQIKVRQILFNLLSNAAKFCENGRISLSVVKEAAIDGKRIHFRVSDTGIGMSQAVLARLFMPFAQADASTTRKYGGTGLGLAISRRFSQMMGGDLHVESQPGKGSVFTVSLPIQAAGPLSGVRRSGIHPKAADLAMRDPSQLTAAPVAGGRLILVIDDDAALRDLLIRMLNKEGYRVVTAESGEEGLRLARELQPSMVFLDIVLEGVDGWTVLTELKRHPETTKIPVVVLSMMDERARGLELGASDFLLKPADRDEILECLSYFATESEQTGPAVS
jgi:CheY-like chemotaxis protein